MSGGSAAPASKRDPSSQEAMQREKPKAAYSPRASRRRTKTATKGCSTALEAHQRPRPPTNSLTFYGTLEGHTNEQADAIHAYTQAPLMGT